MNNLTTEILEPSEPRQQDEGPLEIGQWYWIKDTHQVRNPEYPFAEGDWDDSMTDEQIEALPPQRIDEAYEWLGCIVKLGTNFAKLKDDQQSRRVHFDEFDDVCRLEPDARGVINGEVQRCRFEIEGKMNEIRELTARLGVTPREAITLESVEPSKELSVLSEKDLLRCTIIRSRPASASIASSTWASPWRLSSAARGAAAPKPLSAMRVRRPASAPEKRR